MAKVNLRIAELRKQRQIGQQELAEVLGVTYQSVSKWETGITMPDITLLPAIAEYFKETMMICVQILIIIHYGEVN